MPESPSGRAVPALPIHGQEPMKKAFALTVSMGILLFQAIEVASPSGGWYWPFVDYPMYSYALPEGSAFHDYGFRVLPCDPADEPLELTYEDMGIKYFDFQSRLNEASRADPRWTISDGAYARSTELLTRLARERAGPEYCMAEVRVKRHRIVAGVGYRPPVWERGRAWSLGSAAGAVAGDSCNVNVAVPDSGVGGTAP